MKAMENPDEPPSVAACYFGDGAASEGDFHAALNIAAVRKCPVIFLCRNNGFAISTPTSEQYIGDGIAARGIGYCIETLRVDGTDIFAVYEATREARRRALEDGGRPILLELMSYRVSHHSTSDDSFAYRSRADVQSWTDRYDPISRLKLWLDRKGLWNDKMDKEARTTIRKAILAELTAAEKEKKPALDSIFVDVYAELSEEMQGQREELRRLMTKYPEEYDFNEHKGGLEAL
jgi:2-oxoisovalerate dehydrogenase E1 component alpha subunit